MPARKPTPSGGTPRRRKTDDPLHAEQARLLAEQEALIRQQERARRLIEEAPKRLQELKRKQREPIKLHLHTTKATGKRFGMPHDKFVSAAGEAPARPRARKSERNAAKIQFVLFVVILAAILFMVWRSIPTM